MTGRLIALQTAQRPHGITQPFCGAARASGIALIHSAAHGLLRITQPVQGLLYGRVGRIRARACASVLAARGGPRLTALGPGLTRLAL